MLYLFPWFLWKLRLHIYMLCFRNSDDFFFALDALECVYDPVLTVLNGTDKVKLPGFIACVLHGSGLWVVHSVSLFEFERYLWLDLLHHFCFELLLQHLNPLLYILHLPLMLDLFLLDQFVLGSPSLIVKLTDLDQWHHWLRSFGVIFAVSRLTPILFKKLIDVGNILW